MDVLDDLQDFKDDPADEQKPSPWKKAAVIGIGFLLIIFILSLVFVEYPISTIIRGQLESNPLEGNAIVVENFSIIFDTPTQDQLLDIYHKEQQVEFSVCLLGYKEGNDYFIDHLYLPKQTATFSHVSFEPCREDTLIMLHSHPYKSCLASETDLKTLQESQETNPELLMVIMCEPDKFSVYS